MNAESALNRKLKDDILNIYFGIPNHNDAVNYLQDDIRNNFKAQLRVWIISKILSDNSTQLSSESKLIDWEHAECLIDLLRSTRIESLITLRTLLSSERYRKNSKQRKKLESSIPGSQTGGSFIKDLKNLPEKDLQDKIQEYEKEDFYEKLIYANEAILLHKDSTSIKRSLKNVKIGKHCTIRHFESKTSFDAQIIIDAMESLANIILLFISKTRNEPANKGIDNVEHYISKYYNFFLSNSNNTEEIKKLSESIKRIFPKTIELI